MPSSAVVRQLCRVLSRPVCAASLLAAATSVYSQEQGLSRIVSFGIAPQSVSTALIELSNQAGVQVLMPGLIADTQNTKGVRGRMSVEQALTQLLEGTSLRYRVAGENVIGIEVTDARSNVRLPYGILRTASLQEQEQSASVSGSSVSEEETKQSADDEAAGLQTVIVTGTRFSNRTELESSVPIDVLSRENLRSGGYSDTPSMLSSLVPSAYFAPTNTSNVGSFMRRLTIRGLSASQVLVLVNGKRRHLGINNGSASADFNSFPTNVVGHIEVLRDGAAAQYGSDAIAGVVNILLRRDLGTQVEATRGQTYEGDGDTLEASIDSGFALGDEGFLHTSLYYRNRGMTNRQGYDKRQMYFGYRNGNPIIFPTTSATDATPVLQPGDTFDPREATIDRYNTYRVGDPDVEEAGLFLNSEIPLGAVTAYAFGGYMRREVATPFVFRAPLDNNNVRAIFPDGFQPLMLGIVTDGSLTAGVKGSLGEWDFDLSQGWGMNSTRAYPGNTLNPSLGAASPTQFFAGKSTLQQAVTNFDLTRSFDIGWAAPVDLALGAEFRWDSYATEHGSEAGYIHGGVRVLDGPNTGAVTNAGSQGFGGLRPEDEVDVDRTNYAVYADAETRFWERLTVSMAGRFENYSDFGDTLDGKLSFRVEVNPVLAFRGSVNTGFRAPSLADINYTVTSSSFVQGVSYVVRRFPPSNPVARLMGAKDLEPEESQSYSLGAVLQFSDRFNVALDLYQVDVNDQIVSSSLFNDARARAFFAANGFPDISGASFPTNAIDARIQGLDLIGRYTLDFAAAGQLALTAAMNFNNREVTHVAATPPELAAITSIPLFNRDNLITYSRSQPRRTFNFSGNYDLGDWSFFTRAMYYSEIFTGSVNPIFDQTFSAKWVADVAVTRAFEKFTVTVGANNAFDQYPDEYSAANNPQGPARYASSSPFGYNGGYYYLRLLTKF